MASEWGWPVAQMRHSWRPVQPGWDGIQWAADAAVEEALGAGAVAVADSEQIQLAQEMG